MRIATWNVNSLRARLPRVEEWLPIARPDVLCMQETKVADDQFPSMAFSALGYDSVHHGQGQWNGVAILARGIEPVERRRGLPGDPGGLHSRYIEAAIGNLVIGCLYLPNGNPAPGPKFDFKLSWFERLTRYSRKLLTSGAPVILAGDYNVMPTDLDVYSRNGGLMTHHFVRRSGRRSRGSRHRAWADAIRILHPDDRIYTFWDCFRNAWPRDAGLRIDHLLLIIRGGQA